ncbi:MAG: hypothetical protein L0220_04150 [Acidobacteria bacterium]|nr:hypothetical protein [Acidobacteriota bacterium]
MKKNLIIPVFALLFALSMIVVALAQGGGTSLSGPIVDQMCAGGMVKKGSHSGAAGHSGKAGCALKEACAKSGFGVFADGKFYKFDTKGNELAKAALEKSSKDTGVNFKVTGKVDGENIAVSSIVESEAK